MLKRLRRRFILINMGLLTLVILAVFAANVISTWQSYQAHIAQALNQALEAGAGGLFRPWVGAGANARPSPPEETGGPAGPAAGSRSGDAAGNPNQGNRTNTENPDSRGGRGGFTPVYVVVLDSEGKVVSDNSDFVSMDAALVASAIARADSFSADSGLLTDIGLFYQRMTSNEQTVLGFADASPGINSTRDTAFFMGALCLGALLAFLGISTLLARVATRPIAVAWEQQRRFVADASHELRTPLTVILANTELLLDSPEKTVSEQQRWINSTKEESLRMRGLVSDLLDLAHIDARASSKSDNKDSKDVSNMLIDKSISNSGKVSLDLSTLVKKALLQFEAVFFEQQVQISAEVDEELVVYGDAVQLERLLAILLDNAGKYADTRASLCLKTSGEDGRVGREKSVLLSLNNDGPTIPPEALSHVFERFYRGEASRGGTVQGYGLGLALAAGIVQEHKGSIAITSDDATGTTVSVRLKATNKRTPL